MDLPVKVKVGVKQTTLKKRETGEDIVVELAYAQLIDKLRRMNLLKIESNAYEITGEFNFTITKT